MPKTTSQNRAKRRKVASRLREAFNAGRVNLMPLSDLVGRSPGTVASWISGEHLPPATLLDKIEEVCR